MSALVYGLQEALQERLWAAIQAHAVLRGLGLELYLHNKGVAFIRL